MSWQQYDLLFRLQSPLHVGYRKVGNLMQTRSYVPGKNLWAALTARLTRAASKGADGKAYQEIGALVQDNFRFPYLYPALQNDSGYTVHYPWEDDFDYLFLDSYASTALSYTSQSAEDAMLHETEFVAPCTRTGQPVFLSGNLYVKTELPTPLSNWQDALKKVQVGAERGYGWGRLRLVLCDPRGEPLTAEPCVTVHKDHRLTVHLKAENVTGATGVIEPLIGWERNNDSSLNGSWRLSREALICYAPGSIVAADATFMIGQHGIWEAAAP
jgi:hypothetical protein